MNSSARLISQQHHQHHHLQEERVREMDQIRHSNEMLLSQEQPVSAATATDSSSIYRAQTEASNIRIVTPNYKTGEKPGTDFKIGKTAEELNAKFAETNGDYKAERSQEHFRMQIIDPKVDSHAHLPAHAPREYARKKLMEDFPSLHGKRSFLNLDAMDQRRVRQTRPITTTIPNIRPAPKKELLELDQLKKSIENLQKAAREPKEPPRAIIRQEPIRREVVEVRREVVKPKVTQTVQRFEEKKRTEEVERRVVRRERRHKSHRTRYGHNSSGHHQQEYDWHGGGGFRSNSASRGYTNGHHHSLQPIAYESHHSSSRRNGGGGGDYGTLSDSLRRGDLKYNPNGELRAQGQLNGRRMHKSFSTRDVFQDGGVGNYDSHYSSSYNRRGHFDQPLVEFPPTLPRSGRGGSEAPIPPPHRNGGEAGFYRPITKSRSYADWDEGRGPFGGATRRYDDDMARLENEFRDSHLMRLPDGNVNEKDYRHELIPGGYETYSRETKANTGRKLNREGAPTDFKESSQDYSFKRETQR